MIHQALEGHGPPHRHKVLEIRAVSVSGAGAWARVGENPICTALVAQDALRNVRL